jgi:ABC-type sugar transport system permease subunit
LVSYTEKKKRSPDEPQSTPPRQPLIQLPRWSNVREGFVGYLFILPATIIIFLFGLFPILYAAYMSLYSWRVQQGRFYCASDIELPEGVAVVSFGGLARIVGSGQLGTLLAGCAENYTEIVGSWPGALAFIVGFGLMLGAYFAWNNAFKRFGDKQLILQLVSAFCARRRRDV